MKIRNTHIKTQLNAAFTILLAFVVLLGALSFFQAERLHRQTEVLYQYPLEVRNILNDLSKDILNIRIAHRDMIMALASQEEVKLQERDEYLQEMILLLADANKQYQLLLEKYMGPASDVDEAYNAFLLWKADVDENNRLVKEGDIQAANLNLLPGGKIAVHRQAMWEKVEKIDAFSLEMANELYISSQAQKELLNIQLLVILCIILALSFAISLRIIKNIRRPLGQMNQMVMQFHQGDMNARIGYQYDNEFGLLASSINAMAEAVQNNTVLNDMTVELAEVMLKEDDAHAFFQKFLGALARQTGSQMASVYLLSNNREEYVLFESLGMEGNAQKSFDARSLEGEFGAAILSQKVQLSIIPQDAPFYFHVTNGKFAPKEIITIPVIIHGQVAAIVSLSTIGHYEPQALELVRRNNTAITTRFTGILAHRKLLDMTELLEKQNRELDAQKTELSAMTMELTQQNAELEMQKKQLGEVSEMKTHFLSNMSHELRTPLNSVIALSGLLGRRLKGMIPEEEYRYLEIIERNGKNLLNLINDVLDISRIESGREELEISRFAVIDLLEDVASLLYPLAKQKGIALSYRCLTAGLLMSSDSEKCKHILQNLVSNAIKFTEKGAVDILAHQKDGCVEITVRDTGIGISKEHLPRIFEEFRQADSSTSRKYGGTGLGLAIAKKYVEMLGGKITVSSVLLEGSEFIVTLPLLHGDMASDGDVMLEQQAVPAAEPVQARDMQPLNTAAKTILLVEDNESAIIQISDLITEMGHRVLIAHDANEALAIIGKVIPDAMILDLMMPGIDGFELLTIMRNAEATAHIPVLILTAKHITKDDLKVLKRNNIHQLIQKGDVDRMMLKRTISGMLFPMLDVAVQPASNRRKITGRPKVLLVEDNLDNLITVNALLQDAYDVIVAEDGKSGVSLAKTHTPDLILMDIALAGMDGIEAFGIIRGTPELSHIPVIALTASAMNHERDMILAQGFDGFVPKPIEADELYGKIREVLYGE